MSARRRARDDGSDDERPSGRRSTNWFKDVQQQQRASGRILADVEAAPAARRSTQQGAVPTSATITASAVATTTGASTGPKKLFNGLVAAVPTPFQPSGALCVEAFGNLVASLKEDGVSGVYLNSTWGGEAHSLSVQERMQVVDWFAANATGLPAAVHVTCLSLTDTVALAKHAQGAKAAAIVVSIPCGCSPVALEDALDFINEVSHAAPQVPLLVEHHPLRNSSFTLTELLSAMVARGLVVNLRGAVSLTSNFSDFSGAVAMKGQLTDIICATESNVAAAAFLGASAFAASEFAFAAPLYSKLVAAAQKGDVSSTQQLQNLLSKLTQSIDGVVGGACAKRCASNKALASLRCCTEFGAVRPPGPRLTVHESTQLADGFAAFIKAYVGQVKPQSVTAPPKPIKERDGYNGRLNAAILERIQFLEPHLGIRNLAGYFPHLRQPNGAWRKAYPTEAACNPARHIDHTLLKADGTRKEITTLCEEAMKNNFFAVCVNGSRVAQCVEELRGSGVKVAAVIGFPLGAGTPKAKAREARELVEQGAKEIDMVMNIGAMKDGNYRHVYEDVKAVVDAADPGIVKVIFETCLLSSTEIMDASILCVAAGAQFVKTSTGFNKAGATPEGLDIMLAVVGNESEVKAAGGVRDFATAAAYISAGVARIGTSSGVSIISGKPVGTGY